MYIEMNMHTILSLTDSLKSIFHKYKNYSVIVQQHVRLRFFIRREVNTIIKRMNNSKCSV